MIDKKYKYSEIFYSIQGEGFYTGVPTAWLRMFLCNLQCNGFGQKDPTDPSTYDLPYKDINVEKYQTMEDLPVFSKGCDSSYSWAKKFKPLAHEKTPSDIADLITQSMVSPWNPQGSFNYNANNIHMCFTGGEPLNNINQECSVEVMKVFKHNNNTPSFVTFETNGTRGLTDKFIDYFNAYQEGGDLFFSVSPKLFNVTGEDSKKTIRPDVVKEYPSKNGQLKFVVNNKKDTWLELEDVIFKFRKAGIKYPVWIMPVGATEESQKEVAGDIATEAIKRGYNVSARVHAYLWGNKIGV